MTIEEALKHLIASEAFKHEAKQKDKRGSSLRKWLSRYNKGELRTGGAVDLLLEFGYKVVVKKG